MVETPDISTGAWTVFREGCLVRICNKDARRSYEKPYKSEHAAVCAVARMKHDHRMIPSIAGKILAAEMSGRSPSKEPRITASQVLAVAWNQMNEKARIKVENMLIDSFKKGIDDRPAVELVSRLNKELGT